MKQKLTFWAIITLILLPNLKTLAQEKPNVYALLVGVERYVHQSSLRYAENDALEIKGHLRSPEGGAVPSSQIVTLLDEYATRAEITFQLGKMAEKVTKNDMLIVFLSGHGREGAFLTYDAFDENPYLFYEDLKKIIDASPAKYKVIFVDACYSGSYKKQGERSKSEDNLIDDYYGDLLKQAKAGTAVMLSSKDTETSIEYKNLQRGVFTHFIILGLEGEADNNGDEVVTIEELYNYVQKQVSDYTGKAQNPQIKGDYDPKMAMAVLRSFRPQTPGQGNDIPKFYTETINGVEFKMIYVEGGEFMMGDDNGSSDEKPAHRVELDGFYMAEFEVTQELWRAVMGSDPPELYNKGCDKCPVERVSWKDVQEFIQKLNEKTGKNYHLPSEAQWEYAARGGRYSEGYKYAGSNNIDEVAWYWENSGDKKLSGDWDYDKGKANNVRTHPVGQKKPNELGLYDMSGNVWEWCQDYYEEDFYSKSEASLKNPVNRSTTTSPRVYRGGYYFNHAEHCRVRDRRHYDLEDRHDFIGFRVSF